MSESEPLLSARDPAPFVCIEGASHSPYVMTADHAGNVIPERLGTLGLTTAELETHVAWDIGIAGLCRLVRIELDAFLILQTYSRLVIDCNRPLDAPSSIAELSEHTKILGNVGLSAADRRERADAVFVPYHERIERELARRQQVGQQTILLAMHSFTPRYKGVSRPWQVGILYNRDTRLAHRLLETFKAEGLTVGDNEPYFVSDESDYGVPRYGEQRGNVHVELEIRQDLISDASGQAKLSAIVTRALRAGAAPFITASSKG
jgi:predicted N-formylglutamate amidohydrolase